MSEELKKLEEILANDRKIIEDNYKEIERLNNIINELKLLAIDEKENKYWGNDSYINGKNEGVEELANAILEILDKEK